MTVFGYQFKAKRWPWQPDGKKGVNGGWERFGGGWKYRLGVDIGGSGSINLNLIWGMVSIRRAKGG